MLKTNSTNRWIAVPAITARIISKKILYLSGISVYVYITKQIISSISLIVSFLAYIS